MRIFTLLLCFLSIQLTAQDYVIIDGQIKDEVTQKGIPYAHIGLPSKGIGTVSGPGGYFELKIPKLYLPANLEASFLGYKTFRKKIYRGQGGLNISLQQITKDLQEVVVMEESAVENIIRRAVRKIPQNYPTRPSGTIGFYRETKTDTAQNYIYLAEGVLEVYKTSYRNKKEGMTRLIQGRQVSLLPPEEMSRHMTLSSGHWSAHRFDFVKNREESLKISGF